MKKSVVEKILRDTENGYDRIAKKFSETRKFFWEDLSFIKNYANKGDKVLDFGCGNGRLLELIAKKNVSYYGLDVSRKLIDIAQKKYDGKKIHFQKIASSDSLPFADDFFNLAYAIAVFHHLPGEGLRKKTARELFRVLAPGGYIFVTVWNIWQKEYWKNIFENWAFKMIKKSELDWNDCYIRFKDNHGQIFLRYHHAFSVEEMRDLFKNAGFKVRECKIYNERNILLVAKK